MHNIAVHVALLAWSLLDTEALGSANVVSNVLNSGYLRIQATVGLISLPSFCPGL